MNTRMLRLPRANAFVSGTFLTITLALPALAQAPQPQIPTPKLPTTSILPGTTLISAPTFNHAVLVESSGKGFVDVHDVSGVEFVNDFCTPAPGVNIVCQVLAPEFFVELDGQRAERCDKNGADLQCRLPGPLALSSGQGRTVRLGRFVIQPGGASTAKTFSAFRCTPDIASVTRVTANGFNIVGTAIAPQHPDASAVVTAEEIAQGQIIANIPATSGPLKPDGLRVTLDHPNLAGKLLRFRVRHANCAGFFDFARNPRFVFKEAGRPAPTSFPGQDTTDFAMPGAAPTNATLHIGGSAQLFDGRLNRFQPEFNMFIGQRYSYFRLMLNPGTNVLNNIALAVDVSGALALTGDDPQVRGLININTALNVTCTEKTSTRYRCTIASMPAGTADQWRTFIPLRATGTADASGTLEFRATAQGGTEQFARAPITVRFDAANTVEKVVNASFQSAVTPGTEYTRQAFQALEHSWTVTVGNNGPGVLAAGSAMVVMARADGNFTSGAAANAWTFVATPPPAGCTQKATPSNVSGANFRQFDCTLASSLAPGQALELRFPMRLSHTFAPGTWPSCAGTCLPPAVTLRALSVLNSTVPPLEIDTSNNSTEILAGTLCTGGWQGLAQSALGDFARVKCAP